MNIKQKIFDLLNAIDETSQLIDPEEIIKIDRGDKQNNFFRYIGTTQLDNIFSLLEKKQLSK